MADDFKQAGSTVGESKPAKERRTRPTAGSGSSNTSAAAAGAGTPREHVAAGSTGEPAGAAAIVNQGTPKAIDVNIPGTPIIEVPIKATQPKNPTKKKSAKPAAELVELSDNLSLFIVALFEGIAGAAGPIWAIRPDEAERIAQPAAKILDRLGQTESTNAASDYIALTIGLGVVVIPRILLTRAMKSPKIPGLKGVRITDETATNRMDQSTSSGSNRADEISSAYAGPQLA